MTSRESLHTKVEQLQYCPFKTYAEFLTAVTEQKIQVIVRRDGALQWITGRWPITPQLSARYEYLIFMNSHFLATFVLLLNAIYTQTWFLLLGIPLCWIAVFVFDPFMSSMLGALRLIPLLLTFVGFFWALLYSHQAWVILTGSLLLVWFGQKMRLSRALHWFHRNVLYSESFMCLAWQKGMLTIRFPNRDQFSIAMQTIGGKSTVTDVGLKLTSELLQSIAPQVFSEDINSKDVDCYTPEQQYNFAVANAKKGGSIEKYMFWLKEAATRGHADAQYAIGSEYFAGDSIGANYPVAISWLQKAAEQGHAKACFELGIMHVQGKGVPESRINALPWLRKAAELGHPDAQYIVGGVCVEEGNKAEDYEEGMKWLRKAAEQGQVQAQYQMGLLLSQCAAFDQSVEWLTKASDRGHPEAQFLLGAAYADGIGVSRDLGKAKKLYKMAAHQGLQVAKDGLQRIGK